MKRSIRYLVSLDLIFLMLLSLSSTLGGVISDVLYYSAFVTPLAIYLFGCVTGRLPRPTSGILPKRRELLLALPTVPIVILACMGLAAVCTYLFSLAAATEAQPLSGSFLTLFLLHALIPSVLEELLFRLVPISLLAPYSKKCAVLFSAVLFAVIHVDPVKLPYAFVAGVFFATVDVVCESILPSMLFHLLNNTLSILCRWELTAELFSVPIVLTLSALALIGLIFVVIERKKYALVLRRAFDAEDKLCFPPELLVPIAFALMMSVGSFISLVSGGS